MNMENTWEGELKLSDLFSHDWTNEWMRLSSIIKK